MFVGHVCDAPEKQASKENKMKPAALGTETTEWPNENSRRREQFVGVSLGGESWVSTSSLWS